MKKLITFKEAWEKLTTTEKANLYKETGISRQTFWNWNTGKNGVTVENAKKVSESPTLKGRVSPVFDAFL